MSESLKEPASARAPAAELAPGTQIGEYRVEHKLGQGGMGVVYAAVHPIIGKKAAIKVISPEVSARPDAIERFTLEAQAVNRIAHPNIVDIFSFGALADGRPYFVMELLRGESLAARMQRGPVPIAESLELLAQVCRALEATHRQNIVHRDLKPENVFIDDRGDAPIVKLLDFGIAKLVSADGSPVNLTQDGTSMGTPSYVSPELARGKVVDGRCDVYSLGVMAFELLLGRLPFYADNAVDLFIMHVSKLPPSPRSLWPEIDPRLDSLLVGMLQKKPDDRPTLVEIRETFMDCIPDATAKLDMRTAMQLPTAAVPYVPRPSELGRSAPARPASRGARLAVLGGAAALGALGLVLWLGRGEAPRPAAQPAPAAATPPPAAVPPVSLPPTAVPAAPATPAVDAGPSATSMRPPAPPMPSSVHGTSRPSTKHATKAAEPTPTPVRPPPAHATIPDDNDAAMNPYAKPK